MNYLDISNGLYPSYRSPKEVVKKDKNENKKKPSYSYRKLSNTLCATDSGPRIAALLQVFVPIAFAKTQAYLTFFFFF